MQETAVTQLICLNPVKSQKTKILRIILFISSEMSSIHVFGFVLLLWGFCVCFCWVWISRMLSQAVVFHSKWLTYSCQPWSVDECVCNKLAVAADLEAAEIDSNPSWASFRPAGETNQPQIVKICNLTKDTGQVQHWVHLFSTSWTNQVFNNQLSNLEISVALCTVCGEITFPFCFHVCLAVVKSSVSILFSDLFSLLSFSLHGHHWQHSLLIWILHNWTLLETIIHSWTPPSCICHFPRINPQFWTWS